MPKTANPSESDTVRITLSAESIRLLDELAEKGIYGRNRAEVAGRFVDKALEGFVERPALSLRTDSRRRR
jgi:hypothetical protein